MTAETVDAALHAAKQAWLKIALKEQFPHTPEVTAQLDKLERTVAELKAVNPS